MMASNNAYIAATWKLMLPKHVISELISPIGHFAMWALCDLHNKRVVIMSVIVQHALAKKSSYCASPYLVQQ